MNVKGQKLNRRLGDIEQFEFEKITSGEHLSVVIAVSGWLEDQDEHGMIVLQTTSDSTLRVTKGYLISDFSVQILRLSRALEKNDIREGAVLLKVGVKVSVNMTYSLCLSCFH